MGEEREKADACLTADEDVEHSVQAMVVDVFRLESLDNCDDIFNFGVSSIQVTFLINEINSCFSIELDIDAVIECRTVHAISLRISSMLKMKYLANNFKGQTINDKENTETFVL